MIKVSDLNYIYQQGMPFEKVALHDVNFEIEKGDLVAVIGHTGSGKSTLIQHLNALVKPTGGSIVVDGEDITAPGANLKAVRKKVGLVFQYPEHQLFEETVYRDIAFGPSNMGLSEEEIKERVYSAMDFVGLSHELAEKSPFELSGGQKRRVAIAGVLSMKPSVLILDEPTAGLDPKGRDEILGQLVRLHQENRDLTIIFVSHSMEDVAKIANTVMVMNKGTLVMHDSVANVFARTEELKAMGLSVPEVTGLTHELIEAGVDIRPDVYTVGFAADLYEKLIKEAENV